MVEPTYVQLSLHIILLPLRMALASISLKLVLHKQDSSDFLITKKKNEVTKVPSLMEFNLRYYYIPKVPLICSYMGFTKNKIDCKVLHPISYIQHHEVLRPTSYILHPKSYILHPTSRSPKYCILNPTM